VIICLPMCKGHTGDLKVLFSKLSSLMIDQGAVLATGPGNPPAYQVWTAKTVRFGSKPVSHSGPLHFGRPILDLYSSTRGVCQVWIDWLVPITGSGCQVFQSMGVLRHPTANHKIWTLVTHCTFVMYWPPLVLVMVPDRSFGSWSRLERNHWQICHLGC